MHFVFVTGLDPKYLTTVIPYHMDSGPPDNQALQVLIKSKCFSFFLYTNFNVLNSLCYESLFVFINQNQSHLCIDCILFSIFFLYLELLWLRLQVFSCFFLCLSIQKGAHSSYKDAMYSFFYEIYLALTVKVVSKIIRLDPLIIFIVKCLLE